MGNENGLRHGPDKEIVVAPTVRREMQGHRTGASGDAMYNDMIRVAAKLQRSVWSFCMVVP